jgi:CO/xanthine dehydrogenase FAD-binding subunit
MRPFDYLRPADAAAAVAVLAERPGGPYSWAAAPTSSTS